MKVYRAYIAGLGTSGVLIGSFLLLLMVASAIVAFRGAPGEASNDGLDRLDVTHPGQASRAAGSPLRSAGWAGGDSVLDGRARNTRGAAGRVRGEQTPRGAAGRPVDGAAGPGSAAGGESVAGTGGGGGSPRPPAHGPQPGGTQSAPSLGGATEDVGGVVEQTAGGLGGTVGSEPPPAEEPATGAGEAVSGAAGEAAPVIDGVTGAVDGVNEGVAGATGGLPGGAPSP